MCMYKLNTTRLHCIILTILKSKNATMPLLAMTVNEILANCSNYKYDTIYKNICELVSRGYVDTGCKDRSANTYWITAVGLDVLRELGGSNV